MRALAIASSLLALSCNAIFGIDDLVDAGAAGAGGGAELASATNATNGAGGAASLCPAGETCMPVVQDGTYVSLGGDCSRPGTPLDLQTCEDCSCTGNADNAVCRMDYALYDLRDCTQNVSRMTANGVVCIDVSIEGVDGVVATSVGIGGNCVVDAVTAEPTPAPACTYEAGSPCDGGACVPDAADCVLVTGEMCPSGLDDRGFVFENIQKCDCSCGLGVACVGATVDFRDDPMCVGSSVPMAPTGGCLQRPSGFDSMLLTPGTPSLACTPEAQNPNQRRLCCLP